MTDDQIDPQKAKQKTAKVANKGSGDPVQKAAREDRLKNSLRENLKRRKSKARVLSAQNAEEKKA